MSKFACVSEIRKCKYFVVSGNPAAFFAGVFSFVLLFAINGFESRCLAVTLVQKSVETNSSETELVDAAERNEDLSKWLTGDVDVDQAQSDGMTALHWAAFHRNENSVARLIKSNATVDAATSYEITPLSIACQAGDEKIAKRLLDAKANPNQKRTGGETPLMTASRTGNADIVRLLISHGADIDAKEHRKQTALMWAAAAGSVEVVDVLIESGADVNHKVWAGFTAMMYAARQGKTDVVKRLVKAGVDVNAVMETKNKGGGRNPRKGTSALLLAVENGHFELALEMVELGADPNDQRSRFAPLHAVTWVRKTKVGDDPAGDPPPRGSGKVTSLEFVRKLVAAGAKVDLKLEKGSGGRAKFNPKGASPFLMASRTADIPMMKLLLELGADPKMKSAEGCTAMMVAAGVGVIAVGEEPGTETEVIEAIRMLSELGVDVNASDDNGETAMHGAAYRNYPAAVGVLAEIGADPAVWNRRNKWKATPIEVASGKRPGSLKPSPETIAALKMAIE